VVAVALLRVLLMSHSVIPIASGIESVVDVVIVVMQQIRCPNTVLSYRILDY
jgi:hypothetical protein